MLNAFPALFVCDLLFIFPFASSPVEMPNSIAGPIGVSTELDTNGDR